MPVETFKATAHLQEGMVVKARSRNFEVTVDEPKSLGGTDTAMNPVELVLSALGACQSIVARVYAKKFGVHLDDFWVEVEGDLDTDGFMNKSDVRRGYSEIRYTFHIKTDAAKEQVEAFIQFLERTCPVGDTIANPVNLKLNGIVIEDVSGSKLS
ncbi:OsmC family protein [Brevibacillus agri]|uniref:OsmC family protein n=1 Tax=Brevibacillus agri TaxID=51101 RepID=UPI00046F1039|nr:OsmC family protein [Brevibacillus agri]MBY0050608.1 OsmC family protein [Brevibacillus agri]MCG5251897.1 OsmC family protein [Brevibacillus agri]MED1642546.1 OsmC family protein [Brevibacillus agri]MED1654624.1 OsmC family protein [Brevibacillus agri]MED1688777.1 OsmC family protein [Brevibacillus agri]